MDKTSFVKEGRHNLFNKYSSTIFNPTVNLNKFAITMLVNMDIVEDLIDGLTVIGGRD